LTEECSVSEGGKRVEKRQIMGLHLGLEKRMGNGKLKLNNNK